MPPQTPSLPFEITFTGNDEQLLQVLQGLQREVTELREELDRTQDESDDTTDSMVDGMARVGAAISGVIGIVGGLADAITDAEERANSLEIILGRLSGDEQATIEEFREQGFTEQEGGAAVQVARQLGINPASRGGLDIGRDVAALSRAGVNTRNLPATFQAFEQPLDTISDDLNIAFDIIVRAGYDPVEVIEEITDNTHVYAPLGSVAAAADYIVNTGLAPPEATIQLEQGERDYTPGPISGDVNALDVITPTAAERSAGSRANRPLPVRAAFGAAGFIPLVGDDIQGLIEAGETASFYLNNPYATPDEDIRTIEPILNRALTTRSQEDTYRLGQSDYQQIPPGY